MSEKNKDMVKRMVEAINAGEEETAVRELFAPRAARRVKRLFAEFRRPSRTGARRSWNWSLRGTRWRALPLLGHALG